MKNEVDFDRGKTKSRILGIQNNKAERILSTKPLVSDGIFMGFSDKPRIVLSRFVLPLLMVVFQ